MEQDRINNGAHIRPGIYARYRITAAGLENITKAFDKLRAPSEWMHDVPTEIVRRSYQKGKYFA